MRDIKAYVFSCLLLSSLLLGGFLGYFLTDDSIVFIKPIGDLFLNLILTFIVPLIFFGVASAISKLESWLQFRLLLGIALLVFIGLGLCAALVAYFFITAFPQQSIAINIALKLPQQHAQVSPAWHQFLSVSQFYQLFSAQHILALFIFSILVGMAVQGQQQIFKKFLQEGEQVFMRIFSYIMYLAPLGFLAYFANVVHDLGPKLIQQYVHLIGLYYLLAVLYFVFFYSLMVYFLSNKQYLIQYWRHVLLPATTALATCSSAATIPANLLMCQQMQLNPIIYETVLPLGTMIHKQGSIIGAIFKIALMFSLFHFDLHGVSVVIVAVCTAILVGSVMGAIPSGGLLGELFILAVYGFPNSALLVMAAVSILIDPIATLLNACGNLVSTLIIHYWYSRRKTQ